MIHQGYLKDGEIILRILVWWHPGWGDPGGAPWEIILDVIQGTRERERERERDRKREREKRERGRGVGGQLIPSLWPPPR